MDLFRVLINEGQSKLCLIDQDFEKVHNLQSPWLEMEVTSYIFFMSAKLVRKKLHVFLNLFRGVNRTPPNTLKFVLVKCFINF